MIDYSVFMMKSTFAPDAKPKAYAKLQVKETWNLDKFAKYMAEHHKYKRGLVKGLLTDVSGCLAELLLNGIKVSLGELGTFGTTVSCSGAESVEAFKKKDIKSLNVIFTPGSDFQDLVDRAEFHLVASRSAQNSALKDMQREDATIEPEK